MAFFPQSTSTSGGSGSVPFAGEGGSPFDISNFGTGSNQWMSYPSMPSPTGVGGTGVVNSFGMSGAPGPQSTLSQPGTVPNQYSWSPASNTPPNKATEIPGQAVNLGSGVRTTPTEDPQFTNEMYQYLSSQLGQGLPSFDLSTILPSSGQATAPGTINAPLNSIQQMINQWMSGTMPGNNPILPIWQSEMAAMQQPEQQDLANLRGQAAFAGNMDSSAFGSSLQQYLNQSTLNQQSLLGQLTMQALPSYMQQGATLQQGDQAAIQNMMNEFSTTLPQNNPLMSEMYSGAMSYPPTGSGYSTGGIGSILSDLASILPGAAGGASAGLSAASSGAGGIGSILAGLGAA